MYPLASQSQGPTLYREARRYRPPAPTPSPSPSNALGPDRQRWAGGRHPHSAFPGPRDPCVLVSAHPGGCGTALGGGDCALLRQEMGWPSSPKEA